MVAGMLGSLRSGAAYLPLDPALPTSRISTFLRMSEGGVPLTNRGAQCLHPGLEGADLSELMSGGESGRLLSSASSDPMDIAYVIYTSGSTGEPKGVMCTHAGISNRLHWMQRALMLSPRDVVLHKTSIGFDVSVWELFWPLSVGARLALAPAGAERDPALLGAFIREVGATVVHFVPAMLRMFVRSGEAAKATSLRHVISSGEALSASLRDEFLRASPARLHNLYGPTEASVDVTHHECRMGAPSTFVPIGRPISGVRLRILDDRQQAVPVGAEGELHIGGVALARGYLGRPDLTAAAFVPDPFEPERVLYRTGDRACWMPDGQVRYLGRRDDQVKVRGVRIELGEVELILAGIPGVRECAVLPPDEGSEGLVAAVDDHAPEPDRLRRLMRGHLPDAGVPARFVRLPAIPLLANGKVDRRAVRRLAKRADGDGSRGGPAQTRAEKTIAAIWADVLSLEEGEVGVDANFFSLGGDSIQSIEVVFRCRAEGLELTTQDLFRLQSLSAVAAAARKSSGTEPDCGLRRAPFDLIEPGNRARLPDGVVDAFPLSSLLRGLMAEAATNADYRVYTTTLAIRARYVKAALEQAVGDLVRRHQILRSSFDADAFSEPLQLVFAEVEVGVVEIDCRQMPEDAWPGAFREWIEQERRTSSDFARPPLFRVTVHLRPDRFHLTLTEPYLDGWSATLVLTELLSLYEARLTGRAAALPPPPRLSMADLVDAERRMLREGDHRLAWRDLTAGAPATAIPRFTDLSDEIEAPRRFPVSLSEETSNGLREVSRELAVPLKTLLLAAHVHAVSVLCGQQEVVCGLMVNGRPEIEDGERAVGMFLNVIPLRVSVDPGSWVDLVRRVHEAEEKVLPWRRYPYQHLLKDFRGRRLFDNVFNFTRFRPYTDWSSDLVELLDVDGTDQTYFGVTSQAGVSLHGRLWYALELNPGGFSGQQVDQIVDLCARTLEAIAKAPRQRHERLSLLAPGKEPPGQSQIRLVAPPRIEALLEQRAEDSPEREAFVERHGARDYAVVDREATSIARHILAMANGSRPRRVGVCAQRSVRAVEAMFGALKLGAAFVPLDPSGPPGRLAAILEDSCVDVLLVDELGARAVPSPKVPSLHLEDAIAGDPAAPFGGSPDRRDSDPAQILYTSGSAGRPKGVIVPHGSILNRLQWMARRFPAGEDELYCASGGIGFVDSITTLFSGLLDSVPVFLPPNPLPAPRQLATLVRDAGVTRMTIVPSLLRDLMAELDGKAGNLLGGVRLWVVSGEPLAVKLVRELLQQVPGATVVNLYGTTELTGDVTAQVCTGVEDSTFVAAGTPIDGARVQVLDGYQRDLPIGAPGEVVVSGRPLASGYVGGESAGEESFRYSNNGARRFHTGDLGRLRPDGALELIGRRDRQVKINGVRVEPAEVEAALTTHPAVREVAVVGEPRKDGGGMRLAAYVVGQLAARDLRAFLAGRLPTPMIPGTIIPLRRLPRTPNGKIDYPALASVRPSRYPASAGEARPLSTIEEVVREIWSEVLGREGIGRDDDFFDLGGDSLLAARVLARVSECLQAKIGLRELFDHSSLGAFAARVRADAEAAQAAETADARL
jgi:amino acid adenylation domain-containing protein